MTRGSGALAGVTVDPLWSGSGLYPVRLPDRRGLFAQRTTGPVACHLVAMVTVWSALSCKEWNNRSISYISESPRGFGWEEQLYFHGLTSSQFFFFSSVFPYSRTVCLQHSLFVSSILLLVFVSPLALHEQLSSRGPDCSAGTERHTVCWSLTWLVSACCICFLTQILTHKSTLCGSQVPYSKHCRAEGAVKEVFHCWKDGSCNYL